MLPPGTRRSPLPIRVVLSSPTLLPFISVWKAAAPVIAELGIAGFFLPALLIPVLGQASPWFALTGVLAAILVRAVDVERWALLLPGGLVSNVRTALGPQPAAVASATTLAERVLLAALAALVAGHYAIGGTTALMGGLSDSVLPEDPAIVVALLIVGVLWIRARLGHAVNHNRIASGIWIGVAILVAIIAGGVATVLTQRVPVVAPLTVTTGPLNFMGVVNILFTDLFGFALTLSVLGGGEAYIRSTHEVAPPRLLAMRRVGQLATLFGLAITGLGAFLFVILIVPGDQSSWLSAPLVGIAQSLSVPGWLRVVATLGVAGASALILIPLVHRAVTDLEQILERSSLEGMLPDQLGVLHRRLGTPTRTIDAAAAAIAITIVAAGGRVEWLARAYGIALAALVLLKVFALVRLRPTNRTSRPYVVGFNLRHGGKEIPLGLLAAGALVAAAALTMLVTGDLASIAAAGLIAGLSVWRLMVAGMAPVAPETPDKDADAIDFLLSSDLSIQQVDVRPGSVLVPVRNPHALGHVARAIRAAGDRDIVIMTVRLFGIDVEDAAADVLVPTPQERRLLSEVVSICEGHGRSVKLLIVPARSVFDAIIAAVVRLRASELYVGESTSLSADDQARLLGESWERADKPAGLDVRLVVHHRSGRSDLYHLGAHAPTLTAADLEQLHRLWLDAVKTVGPHLHHHDIVRAALTQMEQQLSGPQRDAALEAIREVARPAEELAAVVRSRDYTKLRDMLRNRDASDVAFLLTTLSMEDQVVVFRVQPRQDAAAVFEYLSQDDKEALLKGMAQEDVAALINNMAPDERTIFLEELPAEATRQLLALLTPEERSIAVTLLGYPEGSVGRFMTPDYVAVRENWSVQAVLDFIREHGRGSETLNHIYTVDDQGRLIDDTRIGDFLLARLDARVSDLQDRRFVALKATDTQEEAVAVFRQYDRTALPVTDTAGMLIGIVTIDDVLDVAEATATREIQRIGGSEALDEPYISIALTTMIRKRAGWLMALFLGEMLTATAMGAFEAEISKAVVLAFFVPLIISSGGNSGSQAATLVIRALALGEVTVHDWWRIMRREVVAGLALGLILGAIGFLRITLWSAFSDIYGPQWFLVAVTVAISLVGVVLWGTLSGSLMPIAMKRLGFDPAASSAPFVATLVDVTGLVIYFTVALVVLRGTLLAP